MEFYFEWHQFIKFKVDDDDGKGGVDHIGDHETELAAIVAARNNTYEAKLVKGALGWGKLFVKYESVAYDTNEITC